MVVITIMMDGVEELVDEGADADEEDEDVDAPVPAPAVLLLLLSLGRRRNGSSPKNNGVK
jgi:hypothetical protein